MSTDSTRSALARCRAAIAAFTLLPLCMGLIVFGLMPSDPVSEAVLKWDLAAQHGKFDTVIVGDSRVGRVGGPELTRRGWNYFNMGLSGLSPEDLAMQLRKALVTQPIARVIMGLSFENMTETTPFQFSYYGDDAPFRDPRVMEFVGNPGSRKRVRKRVEDVLYSLLPVGRAGNIVRVRRRGAAAPPPFFRPDGENAYVEIQAQLARNARSFADPDPGYYFNRPDSEVGYLASKRLSPSSKELFLKIIGDLRAREMPVVMYEIERTDRYQKMIDDDPILHALQLEWRDFFRGQAGGCIRFVEAASLHPLYDQKDFFDAVHYIGATEDRITGRLAEELTDVEGQCESLHRREKE